MRTYNKPFYKNQTQKSRTHWTPYWKFWGAVRWESRGTDTENYRGTITVIIVLLTGSIVSSAPVLHPRERSTIPKGNSVIPRMDTLNDK